MRTRTFILATVAATVLALAGASPALADPAPAHPVPTSTDPSPAALRIARAALPANDGWAASDTGTTGGSAADDAHVLVAHDRGELVAALGGDNATNGKNSTPKIVFLSGRIDGNVDDANQPLACSAYADPGYRLEDYLATYDPAVWSRVLPSGPLEDARARSAKNQTARVVINVGSNTTVIGLPGAVLNGVNLMVNKVSNVIVRNVTMRDARDCFPAWDPTDGSDGNWNSLYDTMSVIGSTHVWVDHDSFSDGANPDSNQPLYFGRPFQVHDGSLDITKAADLVTVEYCSFSNHDKTMLIGSTNTVGADVAKLRVTIHHSRFANVGQRAPRVRFGQVDVYDNYYVATDASVYQYSWGVGVFSAIFAENNFIVLGPDVAPSDVIFDWGGTAITEKGTMTVTGASLPARVSLLDAYNAAHDPDLGADAGWTPTLRTRVDPTILVPLVVGLFAGAGRLAP
jgi:pectate lyase